MTVSSIHRKLIRGLLLIFFISLAAFANSQSFLEDYRKFNLQQIASNRILDSLRKTEQNKTLKLTKRKIKEAKKQWITQLDKQIKQFAIVFHNYKIISGFDFNTADSVLLIYQTDIQSNLNHYLIISSTDTISYSERWKMLGLHSYEREIVYEPFLDTTKQTGLVVIDARDSLLTLASRHDCNTAKKLATENPCTDGSTSTIIFVRKLKNKYEFDYCFLQPFIIRLIWRLE